MKDKIAIIGTGRWAKRIKKFSLIKTVLISPRKKIIDVSDYENIIICVPSLYIDDVIKKIKFSSKNKAILSCVKGLMNNGSTVCQYLRKRFKSKDIRFLGGANIDCNDESFRMIDAGTRLELLGILKNVYAIGFGYYSIAKSVNYSSNLLSDIVSELRTIGINKRLLNDLFASCYSEKSRNKQFGEAMARGLHLSENTIEGIRTAIIIKKLNLYPKLRVLREIADLIYEY